MASGVIDPGLDPEILNQVRNIVRRDIKLSADDPLPPEARLFGGEVDLDSLDMLLLITSIERQFNLRISDRAVGEAAFQTVGSLAKFVQDHRGTAPARVVSQIAVPAIDWLAQLPHGKAFRFISRIMEVRPGEMARGVWTLDGSEAFFAAHFRDNPIVPGVLIVEALAQISGIAGAAGGGRQGTLAHVDVRFERAVVPPAEIDLSSKIANVVGSLQRCDVVAKVGVNVVAQGTITLHRGDASGDGPNKGDR
jgi:3-hydroxyacyl-[acyl-carrier-protein] dehydratase